jgi:hypothetical protein
MPMSATKKPAPKKLVIKTGLKAGPYYSSAFRPRKKR